MTNFSSLFAAGPIPARPVYTLLAGLALALVPLLSRASTPLLRLEGTVATGDVTAFVDRVEIIDAITGLPVRNAVPNAGFEASGPLSNTALGFGYAPGGATWAFAANSGIAANGSVFGNPTAPEANRVAFLQSASGTAISQTLPALAPGLYRVRLRVAQRNTAPANQGVRVRVDGLDLGSVVPANNGAFAMYNSATFSVVRPSNSGIFTGGAALTTDGSTLLDGGVFAAPAVSDVDSDGLLDLLVGKLNGNVARFEQTSSNGGVFGLIGDLTTDGSTLLAGGPFASPAVSDVDGDGRHDLLVGNDDGQVMRFEQTTANGGVFALVGALTTDGSALLNVGQDAIPAVTDVDGDGLLDLLVGNSDGNVQRFEQTTANGGIFASVGALTTNGSVLLDAGDFAAPAVTDVDGDGRLDLLVGNGGASGQVTRFEQTTANGGVFALVGALTTDGSALLNVFRDAAPTVTDVDGDGLLDLLVGNNDGNVQRFEQAGPPVLSGLTPASGPLGTTLTLTGQNLFSVSSVLVGEVPAPFTMTSGTTVTATVPRQATNQKVRVSNAAGTALSATAFQVTRPSTSGVFPQLGRLTTNGSSHLTVFFNAAPAVTDVDGDGLLDLLVGQEVGGLVKRFEQTVPNGNVFASLGDITTDGSTALAVGSYASPAVTDVDGDGLLDLLVGNEAGNVTRFEQTVASGGVFALVGYLTTDGSTPVSVSSFATPRVADLDSDGRLDLLVGETDGTVKRFEQTTANGGVFGQMGALTTDGGTSLDVGGYASPAVTDVEGDGLLDLLVSDGGYVRRYEQTTANGSVFASLGHLTTNGSTALDVGSDATPTVTDLDGDGLLDLLVGNIDGYLMRYEQRPGPVFTALSPAAELPGQVITLTGTGFTPGSTVSFGGVASSEVSYVSPTTLTALVPVGAAVGSSTVTLASPGGTVSLPATAFEVLQVYRNSTAAACLSTEPLALTGSGGPGSWRYLRLPGAGGAVVAAIEDTYNLGTVTASLQALGTATGTAVRTDGRAGRRYLDRNFHLTATNPTFPGQTVRVRFFGLSSELARLQAVDANATLAGLNVSQYGGANENCTMGDNDPAGDRRLVPAPASVTAGADWFTAQVSVADHFSEFYLTGASSPLPVELLAFTARAEGAAARLQWTTASEKNSARFEVERSQDGTRFERLGTVAAAGNSSAPRRYELLDAKLPAGAARLYYRLRQVDQDDTFSFSPVRTVALSGPAAGLGLFPNPTRGAATTLSGAAPGQAVQVLDVLGRPVAGATASADGAAQLQLPAGLPAGVYLVRAGARALRLVVE